MGKNELTRSDKILIAISAAFSFYILLNIIF